MGQAIIFDIKIGLKNSLESNNVTLDIVAPNTFLMPISLVRFSVMKNDNPKIPRLEMIIANKAKAFMILANSSNER